MIIGYHIILSGYGTWLSNDPRGSGSEFTRKDELDELGPVHHGRKRIQPPRKEIRTFYQNAEPLLDFPTLLFDESRRQTIGEAFGRAASAGRYTVWACAVCRNHAHFCVRRHRDDWIAIRDAFANASRVALTEAFALEPGHPVWSSRPYAVFMDTVDGVAGRVEYVRQNPMKEGLPEQRWSFVKEYDGWPDHRRGPKPRK
jgi:hypothetical protein